MLDYTTNDGTTYDLAQLPGVYLGVLNDLWLESQRRAMEQQPDFTGPLAMHLEWILPRPSTVDDAEILRKIATDWDPYNSAILARRAARGLGDWPVKPQGFSRHVRSLRESFLSKRSELAKIRAQSLIGSGYREIANRDLRWVFERSSRRLGKTFMSTEFDIPLEEPLSFVSIDESFISVAWHLGWFELFGKIIIPPESVFLNQLDDMDVTQAPEYMSAAGPLRRGVGGAHGRQRLQFPNPLDSFLKFLPHIGQSGEHPLHEKSRKLLESDYQSVDELLDLFAEVSDLLCERFPLAIWIATAGQVSHP